MYPSVLSGCRSWFWVAAVGSIILIIVEEKFFARGNFYRYLFDVNEIMQ